MSTAAMTPMISPDGDVGDIPQEKVQDAVKAGFKLGVELETSQGEKGVIPIDQAHAAIGSGKFHIPPPKPAGPNIQPQYVDLLTGKKAVSQTGGANPGASQEGMPGFEGSYASGDTDRAAAMSIAGGATAAGLAGAATIPAVLPHTIEGVKAIGTWAAKNPVQAYILYQVMKELIPGAKKTMGIIKDAPGGER